MTASALPVAGAALATLLPALSALAGQASNVPLTRVSLACHREARFKLYLRFGELARTLRLDRWRRCAVFLPRAICSAACAGKQTTTARSAGSSW